MEESEKPSINNGQRMIVMNELTQPGIKIPSGLTFEYSNITSFKYFELQDTP